MNKRDILASGNFGQRIAEDEADELISYFVETEQWRRVVGGQVDVVYGPKGSGKSALYSLLRQKREVFREQHTFMAGGENIRGTPVFEALVADPPASEEQFRGLWKLYFLSLIGTLFRIAEFENDHAKLLLSALEQAGLIPKEWSLKQSLRAAMDYVRRLQASGEVKVNPVTGQVEGVSGKVTLGEPSAEARKQAYVSTDSLLEEADKALSEDDMKFWIVLDRLDVAFAETAGLEENALRALFRGVSGYGGPEKH